MNSMIIRGSVMHQRLQPVGHHFAYPLCFYAIDLSELSELDRSVVGFGYNRLRPVALHDRDYLENSPGSIATRVRARLRQAGCTAEIDRIVLITGARYLNYAFNPVNFYLGLAKDGSVSCAVAEVNNTFGDRHLYVLPEMVDRNGDGRACGSTPKEFHVSPFNDMQGEYRISVRYDGQQVDIGVDIAREGQVVFKSTLRGKGVPLTSRTLCRTLLASPLTALVTMPRIIMQAAKLRYGKRLPVFKRPEPASPFTVVCRPPSRFERLARNLVLRTLGRIETGRLTLILPDGERFTAGTPQPDLDAVLNIRRYDFFKRVLLGGAVGFGEAFVAADFTCHDVTRALEVLIANREALANGHSVLSAMIRLLDRMRHFLRSNTRLMSRRNIREHYDLSNDFFRTFLDESMTYSSARFGTGVESLDEAQRDKLRTIIHKARIQKHHHVLEIGSGWGSFAIEAAKTTGCRVTSITLSEEQLHLAQERARRAGLEDRVTIKLCDYRDMTGEYDRIVSIEMLEAVGHRFLPAFFKSCNGLLAPDGLLVLQVITIPDWRYEAYRKGGDWIRKHIFPGGHLPSLGAMTKAMGVHTPLFVENLENIGPDYARTLRLWRERFHDRWEEVLALGMDETFIRKWTYYLCYCEAAFATRTLNTLQLVLTRPENRSLDQPTEALGIRPRSATESFARQDRKRAETMKRV